MPGNFLLPNWSNRPGSSYAPNGWVFGDQNGTNGIPNANNGGYARIPATMPDGTSNTIAFGERFTLCNTDGGQHIWADDGQVGGANANYVYQTTLPIFNANYTTNCSSYVFGAFGAYGVMVGLMDGSVRIITPGISGNGNSFNTFTYAMLPNDGVPLGPDW